MSEMSPDGSILLTDKEARALFAARVRHYFGLEPEEWLLRYEAGEFDGPDEHWRTNRIEMVLPFWRQE